MAKETAKTEEQKAEELLTKALIEASEQKPVEAPADAPTTFELQFPGAKAEEAE